VKDHFAHFPEITKEEIDGRSSPWRIHEVPEAIRSHRGARRLWCVFSKCKYRENRAVGSRPTGPSDHSHISHLGVSGGEESKLLYRDSRNCERRSREKVKES
jgi:hypothetical protein